MKQNYLFAPIVILIMLIASLLGGYAYGQSSQDHVKTIQIKKDLITEGDSVKIIIKTIGKDGDETIVIDSILSHLTHHEGAKDHKFIQIINGDTIISNCLKDTLKHVWINKFQIDQFADFEAEIESHMEFLKDSCSRLFFSFDLDSICDPLHFMHTGFIFDENGNAQKIKKYIDVEHFGDSIEKQVRLIIGEMDHEMLTIEDFDHNIMVHKQHRILLDDLSEDDKNTLEDKGLKSSNKEPDFDYFKLYPNPSADAVNLNFKLVESGNIEVRVMNMLGQVVYEERIKNMEEAYNQRISLGHEKGTYVLQIIQGNKVISKKIMIE